MHDTLRKASRPARDTAAGPDASWRDLYRVGALSAAACVVLYVVALVTVAVTPQAPVSGGAETLRYISNHRSLYIAEQVLWLAPSLFAMVVFLALYPALKNLNKSYAAISAVVGGAAWALSFAWPATGGGAPALVYLSDQYTAATTAAQRAVFTAAAEGFIAQNTIPVAIGVMQTLGILLVSLLMLTGVFHRGVAYLGVVTGAVGIVSEILRPVLGGLYAIYGVLILAWFAAIAWELYRLERRSRAGSLVETLVPVDGHRGQSDGKPRVRTSGPPSEK